MRASITSDQISTDLNTALELLAECNCREYELRQLGLDSALDADARWLEIAEKSVHLKRFRVTQIATDFFAKTIEENGLPSDERIAKLFALVKRMNCTRIQIFGCHVDDLGDAEETDEEEPGLALPVEEALEALTEFVKKAAAEKIEVVLRTHHDTCAGTLAEAIALIEEIDAPNFGLDWDVGECFIAGDGSGLDEIETALPLLKAVHLRDGVRRGMSIAEWSSLGKGVIPWEDLVEQLQEGGFKGPIICDPSVAPKLKESRHALTTLMRWIDAARMRKRPGKGCSDEFDR